MRYLLGFLCVCALGVVPLLGCSETSGDGDSGGPGGAAGMGGTGGTQVRSYIFQFTELKADGSTPFLEGVDMCEADTDNCSTSDSSGLATLDLVADQEVTITMDKDGYGSVVTADVSDETFGPEGGAGT